MNLQHRHATMEKWTGRVAIVTGASSGIGAAIAVQLAKEGIKVVGLARRVEKVTELANALKQDNCELHAVKCDVSVQSDVTEAFQWVKQNLGGVDILVNNAGVMPANSLIDGPVGAWKSILDVNVLGLSMCTSLAVQSMQERGVDDGYIVHINSTSGHVIPQVDIHMYAASKHAVSVLTEGLRRELNANKSKIRVTSISPGLVDTDLVPALWKQHCPTLHSQDVVDAVVYALGAPPHVQIHDVILRPVGQP